MNRIPRVRLGERWKTVRRILQRLTSLDACRHWHTRCAHGMLGWSRKHIGKGNCQTPRWALNLEVWRSAGEMAQLLKANGDRRQTTKGSDCPAKAAGERLVGEGERHMLSSGGFWGYLRKTWNNSTLTWKSGDTTPNSVQEERKGRKARKRSVSVQ